VGNQSTKPLDIFVLCGELSGDILGHSLLKDIADKYSIEGVLGPNLKTLPIKEIASMECFNFMGLSKPLASIYGIVSAFRKVKKRILSQNPKLVMLIDLPDINLFMARSLRRAGFKGKIIQVVCPTIWAWRKGRKKTLEKYYDHLFCLFPFEKKLFEGSPLKVSYIGHPLNSLSPRSEKERGKIIAVFPGSRKQEVQSLLPDFMKICKEHPEYKIHISVAKEKLRPIIEDITKDSEVTLYNPDQVDKLIDTASVALSKNGTINLHLALSHIPQITCYRVSPFELFVGKHIFRINLPFFSLPNIILEKSVFPELIGPNATFEKIKNSFDKLIHSKEMKESMLADYQTLSAHLKKSSMEDPQKILMTQLCD